ncbi:MAG TPA: hypothetical protein CFH81_08230 [Sulfurovum sp. UBA12169]|nr:MAG TPA: hypothetical protein CFH81_08230 [Sulfurovum sp. UBA12169]
MEQIFFILFLLSVGYSLKFFSFPHNFSQSLNLFIIYVSFPATILLQVPKINFNSSLILPVAVPYSVLFLSLIFVYLFFKNESRNTKAALLLLLPLGNTSFFGFPVLEALVGTSAIQYGIVYDQFGSFVLLTTYGAFIIAYFSGSSVSTKHIMKKIITFPPFIFLFLSFIVGDFPPVTLPYIELLSKTLVPLAIISVGFSMQLKLDGQKDIFFKAMGIKLFLIPSVVLIVFKIFGFTDEVALTTLLESAMPPMITAGALAINAGFAPKLSAALVGYGIVFALFSLQLFKYLHSLV